ncbi:unnamed protein product [marine sediment metagenome]|uniref:Uncharacterized protein n=1 Tax=marine sediment metagenome TaxID=412755 RepID=X0TSN4_9ZZZZ
MQIEITTQEKGIIESALQAYWSDANILLANKGHYSPVGKIPLGDIEKQLLEQRQELVYPILSRFENDFEEQ